MNKGAVYVATSHTKSSKEQTVTELLRSVRLITRYTPSLPLTLVGSQDIIRIKEIHKFFHSVVETKYPLFNGYMGAKIQALELSPYDLTLVLDNDTLPLLDISKGFDFVGPGKRDIALTIAPNQELKNSGGVTNFQNGVMFVYKNSKTLELFKKWRMEIEKEDAKGPTRFIFSRLLQEQYNVSIYALSYLWNFRIDLLLDYDITPRALNKVLPRVRVLHTHLIRSKALNIFRTHPCYKQIKINAKIGQL